ncbi:MAG: histidinol-phosphatase [Calditrichaeota bacterium]|nr:histidinol-phosphatase [Calditrichota bacterium]
MEFHDLHIHTSLCNHASGAMIEYVRSGIRVGLASLGFSDHNPLLPVYENRFRMSDREMEIYVRSISALRERFKEKIDVKMGIELDYLSEEEKFLQNFIDRYPFDYIIGSVHYLLSPVNGEYVYLSELPGTERKKYFPLYFEKIKQAARSGLFDVVAHFDLPKKFWGEMRNEEFRLAERALETIAQQGLALEINTSGLRTNGVDESFPGKGIVQMAKEKEIPFVLGSDSHAPADVGSHFAEALIILKEAEIKNVISFDKRKRFEISIDSGR